MNTVERFKLRVDLRIAKEIFNGPFNKDGTPNETEGYWRTNGGMEQLTVSEEMDLGSLDFLGVMKVLAQLHDSITEVKKVKG